MVLVAGSRETQFRNGQNKTHFIQNKEKSEKGVNLKRRQDIRKALEKRDETEGGKL